MLYLSYLTLLLVLLGSCCGIEPLSMAVFGGIGLGLGLFNFDTLKEGLYCKLPNVECCSLIPADIVSLEKDLRSNLYGQHILIQNLIPVLRGHFEDIKAKKPLVMTFHGTAGIGKNFVSDYIAKHLYKNGLNSKFVHKFGKADFPLESEIDQYKLFISNKIATEIAKCPRSLFIFDEIDHIPKGVFEAITTYLDYHETIKGVDYSQAIYIFLTNTAGKEIGDKLYDLMNLGIQRYSTDLHHFEEILEAGAFTLVGSLQGGRILKSHLIDHFLPFLPLEKQHVKECVVAEYLRNKVNPTEQSVYDILNKNVVYDPDYKLYSVAGCKRLDAKVKADVMANYKPNIK